MEGNTYRLFCSIYILQMIRVPLTLHSPEAVYHFLRSNVGPLYIAVKKNQAIIHFVNSEHTQLALQKYRHAVVNFLPLQLIPYKEGDIDTQPQIQIAPTAAASRPDFMHINEVVLPPPKKSELTVLIEQMIRVNDPSDTLQGITKESRQELIKFVGSFNPLFEAACKRRQQILLEVSDQATRSYKIKEFEKFYKKSLTEIAENFKDSYRALRKRCAKYGQQQNVDLEPNITLASTNKVRKIDKDSYRTSVQYINPGFGNLKRVAPLNDNHFACTAHCLPKGNLLIYNTEDEHIQMHNDIKENAYGLLVLDHHILTGTDNGNIAFFSTPDLTQRQLTLKLHNGMIYEIVKRNDRPGGYSLMTLGIDNLLKLWSVNMETIAENVQTLIFEEALVIFQKDKQINSVDVLTEDSKIAYSYEKNIALYDCVTSQNFGTVSCKGTVLNLATFNENIISVANQKYLSFVDIRNNANTINIKPSREKDIRTLTPVGPYTVFYGCKDGQVGVIDNRKVQHHWYNTNNHKGHVYDVCRVGDKVVSIDSLGGIVSWTPNQTNSPHMILPGQPISQ